MPVSRVGYVYDTTEADYIPFTGPPAALPSGMLTMTAASAAPSGWMLCNGTAISRTTYADLFAAIGTTYGVGNGSTTFNLPDLRGRVPVGTDSGQTEFDALGETGGTKSVILTSAQSGVPAHSHPNSLNGTTTFAANGHTHGAGGLLAAIGATNGDAQRIGYLAAGINGPGSSTYSNSGVIGGLVIGGGFNHYTYIFGSTDGNSSSASVGITNANNTAADAASAHTNLQPYISMNYIIKT
jgi:microcystin-dependent protein